jgi:hypothetical protein
MKPQTMLNLLSIIRHIPTDEAEALHLASEAVYALAADLEALLDPSLSSVLVNGTIQQRTVYADQRHLAATLLLTAHLYLADAARFRVLRCSESRAGSFGLLYSVHRVTLAYAELQRLAMQEIADDHELHGRVAETIADWSAWLADSHWGGGDERRMSNEKSERWKFQVRRSRQFAALYSIGLDGEFPALEHLYFRYPHASGVALLLLAADMTSYSTPEVAHRPPETALTEQPAVAAAERQRPSNRQEIKVMPSASDPVLTSAASSQSPEAARTRSLDRQLESVPPRPFPRDDGSAAAVQMHLGDKRNTVQMERSAYVHLSSFVSSSAVSSTTVDDTTLQAGVQPPKPIAAISASAPQKAELPKVQLVVLPTPPSRSMCVPVLPTSSARGAAGLGSLSKTEPSPDPVASPQAASSSAVFSAFPARVVLRPASGPTISDFSIPAQQAPLQKKRAPSDGAR